MSGHTPGPWTCGDGSQYEPRTNVYCDDSLGSLVATCGHRYTQAIPVLQEEANARLIAAAPELLAAAEIARKALGTLKGKAVTGPRVEAFQSLMAAIAKATGESA